MNKSSALPLTFFLCSFLLFFGSLKAAEPNLESDDLAVLLSPEERALVEKEAKKQSKKETTPKEKQGLDKKSSNPYATLLEEKGVKPRDDKSDSTIKPKKRSSYSAPENYKRYKTGNRRPADALKSTPSQRAFGD